MSAGLYSQISPHQASKVELPGLYGPIAALHATRSSTSRATIVLLVPGYTGSKEDFIPILDPLADSGFEVYAIDLPGQNESPGPDNADAYLPAALGMVIAKLITHLSASGQKVLLLGHSYGGLVARGAVLAGTEISGLTLLCSGPAELPEGELRRTLEIGEPLLRAGGVEAVLRLRTERDATDPHWDTQPEELKRFFALRFLRSHPASLLGMSAGLQHEPDLVGRLSSALRNSGIPALVVCGAADDTWSVSAQKDMADRLDADFAVLPNAGHSPSIENPQALLNTLIPTWRMWLS